MKLQEHELFNLIVPRSYCCRCGHPDADERDCSRRSSGNRRRFPPLVQKKKYWPKHLLSKFKSTLKRITDMLLRRKSLKALLLSKSYYHRSSTEYMIQLTFYFLKWKQLSYMYCKRRSATCKLHELFYLT